MASINYRLSSHAVFPAQIEDCKAAARWLRANAAKYNLDPNRFGVWGSSAGGHLVALLGTTGAAKQYDVGPNLAVSSQVQAVCDYYGPTDFVQMSAGSSKIRQALVSVAEKDPLGAWVDTDDLNGKSNGLHYTREGNVTLGKRFAEKALLLLKRGPEGAASDR